ncbi:putative UV-damaged DNA binding protein, partial [Eremomyces bilateralis CBS 781.70]
SKSNRLEFHSISEDGLSLRHSSSLYGRVRMLQKIRPPTSTTDHLFVGTDRYMYFVLSWNAETQQLQTEKSFEDLAEKGARDSQFGDRCHINPSGEFMTLELYEGMITVLPIVPPKKGIAESEIGTLGEAIQCRIPEMSVCSSTFLYTARQGPKNPPKLAMLYEDLQEDRKVVVKNLWYTPALGRDDVGSVECNFGDNEAQPAHYYDRVESRPRVEPQSSHLLPVSLPPYGMLVLGQASITWINDTNMHSETEPLVEPTIWLSWEQIDSQRYILADEYGRMYMLMLLVQSDSISWKLEKIGQTSRASTLVYLDSGLLFIGSHEGDSQVIQILEGSIQVVQTFANIAPVLDFQIMDLGNRAEGQMNEFSSGQARLVAGSGAWNGGKLCSVRSGVGMEDLAVLPDVDQPTAVFALKSKLGEYVDTLLITYLTESRVFFFEDDGEVSEGDDFKGLELSTATLLARNVGDRIIQVTNDSIRINDIDSGMVTSTWAPPENKKIIATSANDTHIAVSVSGTTLYIFSIDTLSIQSQKEFPPESQIACLSLSPLLPDIICLGFWGTGCLSILRTRDLSPVKVIPLEDRVVDTSPIPRSVLIAKLGPSHDPTLFVSLSSGLVISYSISIVCDFTNRKSVILGTQAASFTSIQRRLRGESSVESVFALADQPSLIYAELDESSRQSEPRLIFSAVTASTASAITPFNCAAYPSAVAIATDGEVRISLVESSRSTHVQSLRISETVRRVGYCSDRRLFAIGIIGRQIVENVEEMSSRIALVDDSLFNELDSFKLKGEELVESVTWATLPDGGSGEQEFCFVGTSFLENDPNNEDSRGRIIVLECTQDRVFKKVAEVALRAPCRCLVAWHNGVAAGLLKAVTLFNLQYSSEGRPKLVKQASYRTATAPIDMAVHNRSGKLVVADLMKSIAVLQFIPGRVGMPDRLEEIARHDQTLWSTAVAAVGENHWLEADAEGNLFLLERDPATELELEMKKIRISAEIRLGEMVNKIRSIDIGERGGVVVPKAFAATADGSIYLLALIQPSMQNLLMQLQDNLAELVKSPGYVPFMRYRAVKTQVREEERPMRFVDGDMIERFMDCSKEIQQKAIQGLSVDVETVQAIIETLRRLH